MSEQKSSEYVSYSRLNTWRDCGYLYFLKYILKVQQRPMWAGVGGTAFHKAAERLDKGLAQ